MLLGWLCVLLGGFAAVVKAQGTTVCQGMLLGGLLCGIHQGSLLLSEPTRISQNDARWH